MKPLVLVGEAFGRDEEIIGKPFVGASGVELLHQLSQAKAITLTQADRVNLSAYWNTRNPQFTDKVWQSHLEVYRTNVFNLRPPENDVSWFCGPKATAVPGWPPLLKGSEGYVRAEFLPELERLRDEIKKIQPNCVVVLGNTPLWFFTGENKITKARGIVGRSLLGVPNIKLLPCLHPAFVLRNPEARPTTIADLMKAVAENEFSELRRPQRQIWVEPSLKDIRNFVDTHVKGCQLLSVDIETSGASITSIAFAPSANLAITIPFLDPDGNYWETAEEEKEAWLMIREVLEDRKIPKLFQNAAYDVPFLFKSMAVKVFGFAEDSMLLAHALMPEAQKSLEYLGSIYSNEAAWKRLGARARSRTNKREG